MSSRVRASFNPHIQWFHPPFMLDSNGRVVELPDSLDVSESGVTGSAPDLWALELGFMLDRLWRTHVGRAVMSSVRRRTTIFPTLGGAQADSDPFPDRPGVPIGSDAIEDARMNATTVGARARIWIDLHAPTRTRQGAVASAPEASLLHELVHAVNITWGNYRLHRAFVASEVQRLGVSSLEEEFAWVIDNMYRSERGMWLRAQYAEGEMVAPGRPLSGRRESELRVAARCNLKVRMLAARLEQIDPRRCPYNPFREYAAMPPTARP